MDIAANGTFTVPGGDQFTVLVGTEGGDANSVALELTTIAVPEPGTWAMMISGAGMLLVWQRRRFHRQ